MRQLAEWEEKKAEMEERIAADFPELEKWEIVGIADKALAAVLNTGNPETGSIIELPAEGNWEIRIDAIGPDGERFRSQKQFSLTG